MAFPHIEIISTSPGHLLIVLEKNTQAQLDSVRELRAVMHNYRKILNYDNTSYTHA